MTKKKYDIPAKPTMYKGRLYRSRLEARVAVYFELEGYEFEYEPEDFEGWSPDFKVTLHGRSLYVEVKPDNEMFDIKKYMSIDFDKYGLMLISPTDIILFFAGGICLDKPENYYSWTQAANTVMFLKPE